MSTETSKAFDRRKREGWFERYAKNLGIDIGAGDGPLTDEIERWDIAFGNSDATFMAGIPAEMFDYVYSSHLLEHLADPITALRSWWHILKPDGHLIVVVPHRDLYEKKRLLPSRFNGDHKHFFLPVDPEPPDTLGLLDTAKKAIGVFHLESLRVLDENYNSGRELNNHPSGEYSIELILRKPPEYLWH